MRDSVIDSEISITRMNIEESRQIWSQLIRVAPAIRPPPTYIPDQAMLEFALPPLRANGPVFGFRAADKVIQSPKEMQEVDELHDMLSACVAHRLAHALSGVGPFRSRELPVKQGTSAMIPVSSLIEELRRSVEIDTDAENKVDELTVELLCKANITPRGLPELMQKVIESEGSRAVDLPARLQRAKALAVCLPHQGEPSVIER